MGACVLIIAKSIEKTSASLRLRQLNLCSVLFFVFFFALCALSGSKSSCGRQLVTGLCALTDKVQCVSVGIQEMSLLHVTVSAGQVHREGQRVRRSPSLVGETKVSRLKARCRLDVAAAVVLLWWRSRSHESPWHVFPSCFANDGPLRTTSLARGDSAAVKSLTLLARNARSSVQTRRRRPRNMSVFAAACDGTDLLFFFLCKTEDGDAVYG